MQRYEPTDDEVKQAIKDAGDLEANDAVFVLRAFAKSQFPQPTVLVRDVLVDNHTTVCFTSSEVVATVQYGLAEGAGSIYIGYEYEMPIDETSGDR